MKFFSSLKNIIVMDLRFRSCVYLGIEVKRIVGECPHCESTFLPISDITDKSFIDLPPVSL